MTKKPIIREHNIETNEIIDREMTESEFLIYSQKQNEFEQKKIEQAEAEAKREAALAKLAALGLEPDDLKALGL
jgi:hypothetical protein